MKRRRRDQARVSAFVKRMAERDMRRLDQQWSVEEDPGLAADIELVKRCFISWHDHRLLPSAGGTLDQDPDLMEALLDIEYRVAYTVAHYGRVPFSKLPPWKSLQARHGGLKDK